MGAPFAGGEVVGPAIGSLDQKVSWVEKFVAAGAPAVQVKPVERTCVSHLMSHLMSHSMVMCGCSLEWFFLILAFEASVCFKHLEPIF